MDKLTQHLTPKEKAFCEYYCNYGCSAVEAIYESGYRPKNRKTAYSMGCENLRKPKIRAYISEVFKNFKFSDDEILHEHLYLIKQHHDLPSKVRALDLFYKKSGAYLPEKQENHTQTIVVKEYNNMPKEELETIVQQRIKEWATTRGYRLS